MILREEIIDLIFSFFCRLCICMCIVIRRINDQRSKKGQLKPIFLFEKQRGLISG
jgi:hypothetical protein